MAKSTSKKNEPKAEQKTTSSFSKKDSGNNMPAEDNSSKYQPTSESDMDAQQLDPADGVMKLFEDCIKDIYWAENHLVKALPKMAKSAASAKLADAITDHLEQTKGHVKRLEQVFDILGKTPQAKKCDAMEGLTREGEGVVESTDKGTPARDLGIIMASQKVEHYEISAYTGLAKLAGKLGHAEIADLFTQTLEEEKAADEILAGIADDGEIDADK